MDMKVLEILGEGFLAKAMKIIQNEDLIPAAFLVSADNIQVILMPWSDRKDKLNAVRGLAVMAKKSKATGAIIIADSYYIQRDKGAPINEQPSLAPDRKDAIVVNMMTSKGDSRLVLQPYTREESGEIRFLEQIKHGPDQVDATFHGIFQSEEANQRWLM